MTVPGLSRGLDLEDFGVRVRVYPTRLQQQVLKRWIGTQRYIYNRKREELDYQLRLKAISKFSDRFEVPEVEYAQWDQSFAKYKHSAPWMAQIPSVVRRNSCSRFKAAMSKWGSGTGRKPQSKTRHSKQSVLLTARVSVCTRSSATEGGKSSSSSAQRARIMACLNGSLTAILTNLAKSRYSRPDGKWFVGFSFQAKEWIPAPQLPRTLSEVLGNDRGVVNPVTDNTGRIYDFTEAEKRKLVRRDKKRTDLQVKLTRQRKGSRRRAKTKRKIAATHAKDRRLRTAVAHRISNHLVVQAVERGCAAIGFEDLRLANMTKRANPKRDPLNYDQYLPNQGAAKTGLNRALLGRNLGRIKEFTQYKSRRAGLMFVEVEPAGTSTECTACHHKDARNRLSQADFRCVRCGHREHADRLGGSNVQARTFQKITEISPGTSLQNARRNARKGQPVVLV